MFNYNNDHLIAYIMDKGAQELGWNIDTLTAYIKEKLYLLLPCSWRLVLKYISFSIDAYKTLWIHFIENMNIEGTEEVEHKLKAMGYNE